MLKTKAFKMSHKRWNYCKCTPVRYISIILVIYNSKCTCILLNPGSLSSEDFLIWACLIEKGSSYTCSLVDQHKCSTRCYDVDGMLHPDWMLTIFLSSICLSIYDHISKSWKLVFRGFPYMGMFD